MDLGVDLNRLEISQPDYGEQALEITRRLVKSNDYNAILMDINLHRGIDGIELTKIIRKIDFYKNVPIIALTAFAMGHEKEEFLSKGMDFYLSKPFNKVQLLKLLEECIQKH